MRLLCRFGIHKWGGYVYVREMSFGYKRMFTKKCECCGISKYKVY